MRRLVLLSFLALGGCLDFDQLAADCVARGDCQSTVTAPELLETSPANQAADVRLDTSLSLAFSKAMSRESVTLTLSPPVALSAGAWSDEDTTFTVQPQAALAPSTSYTVTVAGRSTDGAALAANSSFTFTTQAPPDTQAPTLSSTQPVNGATAVTVSSTVTLVFSEAMATASVQLTSVPSASWGTPGWSTDGRTATFTPPVPLEGETTFSLTVGGTDLAGNALAGITTFLFTTAKAPPPPDITPPTVVATTPDDGATAVATSLSPTLFFSEPMKRAELLAAMTVSPSAGIVLTTDDPLAPTQVTLTHAAPLPASTLFTVTVGTGAVDLAGNALATAKSFSFTTGTAPDTTPPTVLSVDPVDGGTGAPLQPTLVLTFSEPMDPAATQAAVAVSQPAGVTGTATWSNNNTRLSWKVNQTLTAGQEVRWQLGTGARDLSGIALAQTQTWSFRVRRRYTLTLDGSDLTQDDTATRNLSTNAVGVSTSMFRVGDYGSVSANLTAYRALFSFNLSKAPADLLALESAKLRLSIKSSFGTPLVTGRGVALQVASGPSTALGFTIDDRVLACGDRSCRDGTDLAFFTSAASGATEKDVTGWVELQVQRHDARLNFRLVMVQSRFGFPNTYVEGVGTSGSDYLVLGEAADDAATEPRLTLQYLAP